METDHSDSSNHGQSRTKPRTDSGSLPHTNDAMGDMLLSSNAVETDSIRVFVRIRPLNKRELAEKGENQVLGWNFNETSMIEDTQNGQRVYSFDRCFNPSSNNAYVYDCVGKPIVLKTMEGYNGTVFSYGQTGSGKTWTMRGSDGDPGMMILCIRDIFEWIETHPQQKFTLKASYMEVYNEEINDLLGDGVTSKNLRIVSEDAVRGAVIEKLIEEEVSTSEDFMQVLSKGEAARQYAATHMNAESSRSHTIYRVVVEVVDINPDDAIDPSTIDIYSSSWSRMNNATVNSRISYLNLVDLAGSERQKLTNASGKTLKEGANINKSLLALGACISKLGEASKKGGPPKPGSKPVFIPFRDSKLTRILKQSLAGNTMTSVLCAVTPAAMHREETVSTLKFGQLCKTIKNSIKNVEVLDDQRLIKQYRQQIQELRVQLEEVQSAETPITHRLKDLETYIIMNNLPLPAPPSYDESNIDGSPTMSLSKQFFPNTSDHDHHIISNANLADSMDRRFPRSPNQYNPSSRRNSGVMGAGGLGLLQEENQRMTDKINDLQKQLLYYERKFEEFRDYEEAKIAFDDYEINIRNELDEERGKLEIELQNIQIEKYKMLSERTTLEEKESRIGLLLTNLDEKDSKLRQILDTIREQRLNLDISILELKRREEMIQEYQRTLNQREVQLQDRMKQADEKMHELSEKEKVLTELDSRLIQQGKELTEREQRIQSMFSRVANTENEYMIKNEALQTQESVLRKKEYDIIIKEQEMLQKHNELTSFENILHNKEEKLTLQQHEIDIHEEKLQQMNNKLILREENYDSKIIELHRLEQRLQDLQDNYQLQYNELQRNENILQNQFKNLQSQEKDIKSQFDKVHMKEKEMYDKEILYKNIIEREKEINRRIEAHDEVEKEFYHVKVVEITSRHKREIESLDLLIKQQSSMMTNYQLENTKNKDEIKRLKEEVSQGLDMLKQRDETIIKLHEHPEMNNSPHKVSPQPRDHKVIPSNGSNEAISGNIQEQASEMHVDQLLADVAANWDDCMKVYADPMNQSRWLEDSSSDEEDHDSDADEYHDEMIDKLPSRIKATLRGKIKDLRAKSSYLDKLSEAQSFIENILVEASRPPAHTYDRRYVNKQVHISNPTPKERRGSIGSTVERRSSISSVSTRMPSSDSNKTAITEETKQSNSNPSNRAGSGNDATNTVDVEARPKDFYRGHSLTSIFSDMPNIPPVNVQEASPPPPPPPLVLEETSHIHVDISPMQYHPSLTNEKHAAGPRRPRSAEKSKLASEVIPPITSSAYDGVQYIRSYNQPTGRNGGGKDVTGVVIDQGYRGGVPVTTVTLSSTTRRKIQEGYGSPQQHEVQTLKTPPRRSRYVDPPTPN